MRSMHPFITSHRPPIPLTITPPGSVPRAAIGALACSLICAALVASAALLGLDSELPASISYNEIAFRLMAHKLLLVTSAVAALTALVLGVSGWKKARLMSSAAILISLAWTAFVFWARFANT